MDSTTLSKLVQRTAADLVPVAALESGRLVFANAAFHRLFGLHTAGAAIEPELVALVSGPADGDPLQRITRAIDESDGETTRLDLRGTRADGSVVELDVTGRRVQLGASSAIVAVASDVTRSRRALEQLDRISMHDPLTGLPNRSLFTDRLSSLLRVSSRSGEPFAVMFGDLDGFKAVNDGHGHETGDAVLRVVARRLRSCLRDTDTVARIGGDEFAVLLPLAHSAGDAAAIATRLVAAVRAPIVLGERTCSVGLSIGIATYPAAAIDADSLLAGADAAMYRVKSAGKDGYALAPAAPSGVALSPRAIVEWDASHEVGHRAIDAQHAELARRLNRVGDALKAGDERDAIAPLLADVTRWTRHHFECEERIMTAFDFPERAAHGREHRALLDDLESFGRDCGSSVALALVRMREWLLGHVEESDRPLAEYLRQTAAR